MSFNRRPLLRPLALRWQNQSIRRKLAISLVAVLVIAIVIIVTSNRVFLQASLLNDARQAETTRITDATLTLLTAMDGYERALEEFRAGVNQTVEDYLYTRQLPAPFNDTTVATVRMNTALGEFLTRRREVFAEARFLDGAGNQIARITRNPQFGIFSVVTSEKLVSEGQEPYFIQLSQLPAEQIYLVRITSVGRTGGGAVKSDVLLEYAIPFRAGDKNGGYLFVDVIATDALLNIVGAASRDPKFYTAVLDESRRILVSNPDGTPTLFDPVSPVDTSRVPSDIFGDTSRNFESRQLQINNSTVNVHLSTRPVPVRTIRGIPSWTVLVVQYDAAILSPGGVVQNALFIPPLLVLLLVAVSTFVIARRLTLPLQTITDAARQIASGSRDVSLPTDSRDEFGQVGQALNSMAAQTNLLVETLETRISARTRDIENTAQISRDLANIRDVETLLQRTVDTLRDRFGFYHVQVFLLDDKNEFAVLRSSTGEVGRQLLARNHKLAVGSLSVIGQVTEHRRAFVTLDTRNTEVPHKYNPLLPNTRSEMGLPLEIAGQLIGALDVQSEKPDAFDDNTVRVFQVLADQLAAAIQNARLLNESQTSVEQVAALNRQLTREGWQEYMQGRGNTAYTYDMIQVQPIDPAALPASADIPAVNAEIRVRGETIGLISALNESGQYLGTEDRRLVQAIADRVALAIDNVRLVERTQSALAEIRRLYQASRQLSAAPDLPAVFSIVAEQISNFEQVHQVGIWRAGPDPVPSPQWMTYVYDWQRDVAPTALSGRHIVLEQFPFLRLMTSPRDPLTINNVEDLAQNENWETAYRSFKRAGIQSILIVPLATATRWLGLLMIASPQANAFNQTFMQFALSVADQLGIAIENRQLFEETQREARRNRALAEAAQIVSLMGLDFADVATRLLRAGADAAVYDRWYFGQIVGGAHLRLVSASYPEEFDPQIPDPLVIEGSTLAVSEVVRHGTPVVVNERNSHNLVGLTPQQVESLGKHLALPVQLRDGLYGVLMIGRPFVEADIGGDDWQLVGTLVNQLQVAAENRRLFAETQSGRETLQSILNSLPAGVIVVDSNSRQITLANRQMTALFGIDSSGHTPTSTLLPSAINPRSPRFAPFRVLNERGNVNETVSIDYGEDDQRTYLVSAAPIYAGDELVAAVAVFTDTTELHLLEVALEENLNEISQTYEASRVLKDQRTPFDVYQTAYHQMLGFTPVEAFYLIRCTPDGTITEMYRNADETTIERIDALPFSPDLLSRSEATRYGGAGMPIPNTGQPPLLSMISQPISLGKDQLMGWMVLGFYSSYVMRGSEENFSGALAVQVAVSLETLRLSDQTQRALTEARTLYSASRAISAAGTLESAAETVREQLLTRFQPDRIDVFIVADRTRPDRIEWKVRYEATPPPARSTLVLENSYISDSDFLTAEPLFLGDVETATEAEQALVHRLPIPEDIRAQASVPLRIKENTLGRVVMSFFAPQQFEESDRQFVQTLVEQAATVVDNALLYRQTNESLEEATALYNASRAVADAQDSNEILNAIVNHAMSPDITRAMLIMLLTLTWDASEAYIEVAADWSRGEIIANMTGMRLTPEDFPAWKQISKPDIMYVDAVMDAETLDDESRLGFETMGIVSFVTVPLQVAGKPLGAFLIASENPHEHTARELRIYKALADQAAITLENRNLLRQTESRARQLETSAQISKAATSTLDLNELLNATVNLIRQSFGYDHAQIFLISDDGKNAELKASTGEAGRRLLEKKHALGVGSASVIGRVTSDGRSYNVMDTADSRQTHKANPELPNTRAELAIPIVARGKTIGALDVQSNIPGAFRTEDERVLESLADQIGVAIENARLFEQSTRRMEEQRFLFNVTRTAASTEIDNSFARITRDIMEQTSSDVVVLLLPDSEKKRMIVNYAAREPARHIIPESLPVEHEMISKMLRTRQPGLYEDNAQGLLFSPDDVPGMRSLVAVPLVGAGEVVGIIAALATRQRAYNAESLQLMATLASTLTAIVQNARLLGDLQEANQRLREVDKLKSQFLANMSHELRTPLNSIIGFSRVILKGIDGPLNDTQSQDLTTIHESGKHLLNLVNDILDQAKIEAGKMELASDYFKLDDMIKSVMSTAVGLVKDKPIRLHQEIQANLPQIYADEFRTRQVLLNILSNAAKFTRQGSITVTAFTVNEAGRDMVQVSVTDTGIGISKENIRRVFAQFEQVDNSTARGAEGTGLGMPIAKSLIEMMGGRIWLESEVGVGSTFNITLPTQQTEGVPANGMPEAVDIPAAAVTELDAQVEQAITLADNPRPLQRIVITIDDEPGMINMYRRYLAKHGFEVIGTTNPNEAADLIVTYQPSVILLDVNMPGRNGWEVLEELKELDETFEYPVIVCSIEDDKARAFRLGAADYLVKPFVEEDLLRALRRVQLERTLPGVLIINPDQEALSRVRPVLTAQEDLLRYLEATSPEQAIDMIENHRPNLVIFDLRSSALDVLPLISHIRRHPGTSGARLLVIPGAQLADDDLVRMAEQNVHFESGLTDDAMMAMVRIQLGLNGHAQS